MPFTRTTMVTSFRRQLDDRRFSFAADLVLADSGCQFDQAEPIGGDIKDADVGDDPLHHSPAGVGQAALVNDLVRTVPGHVLHDHDHSLGAVHQVHGAAHAFDHLPGNRPVGDVTLLGYLHGAQDGDVDLAASNHAEG